MRRRIWTSGVLTLALLGVAGCGGGGDDDSSTTEATTAPVVETLTKADLITQGDAICGEVNAALGTVAASDAEPASRVAQEADLYSGMVDRLKGLGTPDDTAGYDEFIGAAETLAQAENDASLAAARGDTTALQAAESDASSALASFQSAAEAYGFEECGAEPSAPVAPAGTAPSTETEEPGAVEEEVAPEVEPEVEVAPETGGAGGEVEGGGATSGGGTAGGGAPEESGRGSSGGIGPG